MSGQCGWYQNVSRDDPLGIATVCVSVLSPLTAAVDPTCTEYVPECAVVLIRGVNAPLADQPPSVPFSKPPFTTPCTAVTVSATLVMCVAVAPVPVTVIVELPGAADAATLTVIVDDPPAVTDDGLKLTVTPVGRPLALSATVCAEPPVTAVKIVDVPPDPCATLRLLGFVVSEKSDGAATLRLTVVVWVAVEPVPVTVTV